MTAAQVYSIRAWAAFFSMRPHDLHGCEISGEEIRSVRTWHGMAQPDFAREFAVDPSTVSMWERNGVSCRSQKFNYQTFRVMRLARDTLTD